MSAPQLLTAAAVVTAFLLLPSALLRTAAAAQITVLAAGGRLSAGDTLISSPAGVFEMGFFSTVKNASRVYLGVWYSNTIPAQTVAWVANRDAPAMAGNASARLTVSGDLQVLDGGVVVWSTNESRADFTGNVTAQLLDTGDLVLESADGTVLWESFAHPGNTLLPGMKVGLDKNTGQRQLLACWKDDQDPGTGDYVLGLDPLGSGQAFIWHGAVPYWRSGQWNGQNFVGIPWRPLYLYGFKLISDQNGMYYTYTASNDSLQRFVVAPNGTDIAYMLDNASRQWKAIWMQPSNECEVYGTCSVNALCTAKNGWKGSCACLKGFEPTSLDEWNAGNWTRGCSQKTLLACQQNKTGDGFFQVSGIKLPDLGNWVSTVSDEEGCKNFCMQNCSCSAYTFTSGTGCLTWGPGLIDIYQFSSGGYAVYLKLPASELGTASWIWITATIVSIFSVVVLCVAVWWWFRTRPPACITELLKNRKKDEKVSNFRVGYGSSIGGDSVLSGTTSVLRIDENEKSELPVFSFDCLVAATDNFSASNKLGQGGFGDVYKGILPGGELVAIKRLSARSVQGTEEFENEIILIAKLQHRNLVRLLGCCLEGEEKMLVYEYMPNKSLDALLFDPEKRRVLDWKMRFDIIEGIARGLLYLHRDSRLRIIHRDLKASNVLLDNDMNPKISDFGMARIFGGDQHQVNTNRVVGTFGYMAPEYAMEGVFSVKSDVFSFGILILEIITGRKNSSFHNMEDYMSIVAHTWKLWNEDNGDQIVDESIRASCPIRKVLRCVHIALLCVQDRASDRPDIPSVILMLSSDSTTLPAPRSPFFTFIGSPYESEESKEKAQHTGVADAASISMLRGR